MTAIVVTAFQVTASATQMSAASTSPRRSRVIYNNGPNPIVIGPDATVTLASGFIIPAGGWLALDKDGFDAIFAICSVLQVSPSDTRILTETPV